LNLLARNSRKKQNGSKSPTNYLNAFAASGYRVIDASPKNHKQDSRSKSSLLPSINAKTSNSKVLQTESGQQYMFDSSENLRKDKRYGSTIDMRNKQDDLNLK